MEGLQKRIVPDGVSEEAWNKMGLIDKCKLSYQKDHVVILRKRWPSQAAVFTFWYTAVTQLYCFISYIIPEYFGEYDPTTRYYLKVFITILFIEGSANWFCVRLYSSVHEKTPDNPDFSKLIEVDDNQDKKLDAELKGGKTRTSNHELSADIVSRNRKFEDRHSDRTGLLWGYCKVCDFPQPPRAHHCKVCNACILKRDHHCFFTDTCVGFCNQRYFVVLNLYIAILCVIGLIFNILYLNWKLSMVKSSWWDFCLPYAVYRCLWLWEFPVYYVYMVSHLWIMPLAGALACALLVAQILAINAGKTTQEISDPKCKIWSTGSTDDNFRSVFGPFWGLNFLIPAVLVFRQEEDGKHWRNVKKICQEAGNK